MTAQQQQHERWGEYADKGDYHRELDPTWPYYPVYVEKMARVRAFLDKVSPTALVVDLGCGEGLLVEEYHQRGYNIEGVDYNFSSAHVRRGDITNLHYESGTVDVALALDVLEHLSFEQQELALAEIARVLAPDGCALLSLPNLAHLASRVAFALTGKLIRTSTIDRHPGDRPIGEYIKLIEQSGLRVVRRQGLFPTLPLISALTYLAPARALPLHRLANRLRVVPAALCFLNLLEVRR